MFKNNKLTEKQAIRLVRYAAKVYLLIWLTVAFVTYLLIAIMPDAQWNILLWAGNIKFGFVLWLVFFSCFVIVKYSETANEILNAIDYMNNRIKDEN